MELTPENLNQMERQSLISLADQLGVKFGGNSSNETIAKKILESDAAKPVVAAVESGFTALESEHEYADDEVDTRGTHANPVYMAVPDPRYEGMGINAPSVAQVQADQRDYNRVQTQNMHHTAEQAKAAVVINTPEQVDAMLAPIKARVPDFKADYNLDENTWQFSCKGAVESGNLAIPLRVIKMKAETVSVGARRMPSFGHDGTIKGYAGTILR